MATACSPPVVAVVIVVAPVTPNVLLNVPVVNAPVPGVTLPIATACNPPVVCVVNAPVPGVTLPMATACSPPVVCVVNAPVPGVTLPIATACSPPTDSVCAVTDVNAPVPGVTLPMATACSPPVVAVVKVVAPVTLRVPPNVPVVPLNAVALIVPVLGFTLTDVTAPVTLLPVVRLANSK